MAGSLAALFDEEWWEEQCVAGGLRWSARPESERPDNVRTRVPVTPMETWMEFEAPGIELGQSWLWLGIAEREISLPPPLC